MALVFACLGYAKNLLANRGCPRKKHSPCRYRPDVALTDVYAAKNRKPPVCEGSSSARDPAIYQPHAQRRGSTDLC
ncbi:hypothetical protein BU25DRAFT_409284 [Macroventuria anomochaeta]|uniref:Uncharacterized protein n=1 Tax=Macroventuria anomochaeta TaxID=301207 RepID=A0ACB6S5R9_9PLEO|nr:uncharacterized protein BU25DRAFT_409284 [Macroventuria anomochaeta]KAF2629389.1 hypothetical protein BU25DRAFT_409284 [Macroventuria anomochaeta]